MHALGAGLSRSPSSLMSFRTMTTEYLSVALHGQSKHEAENEIDLGIHTLA